MNGLHFNDCLEMPNVSSHVRSIWDLVDRQNDRRVKIDDRGGKYMHSQCTE